MEKQEKKKASAYSKRNSNGAAAPVDTDSDSDFNAGPLIVEVEEKKKTRRKTRKRGESEEENFVNDESDASSKPRKKKRRTTEKRRSPNPGNPLLEFFKSEFTPGTEEDDEDSGYDAREDEDESDGDVDMDEEGYTPSPPSPSPANKFAAYVNPNPKPSTSASPPADGGDTTEDDSCDDLLAALKPKPSSEKPSKPSADSDVTESDSSPELMFPQKPSSSKAPAKPLQTPNLDPDSETESDSEFEPFPLLPNKPNSSPSARRNDAYPPKELAPKPGFPVLHDQPLLGPVLLDAAHGIQVPAAINQFLRDYQRDGAKFFWERYNEGRGGLLGDDMGLGKTIQVISFLSAIMKKDGVKTDRRRRHKHVAQLQERKNWKKHMPLPNATWPTCLIIAPSTVVLNWAREFEKWGYFEVGCYTGSERKAVLNEFKLGRLDVVLTSLDIARRDIVELQDLAWSCVFVDEVHTVKNPKSKTSRAFNEFECIRRFGLTGTAIQNSYDELWTILDWSSPGAVGSIRQWRSFVSKPLQAGQSSKATDEELARAKDVSDKFTNNLLPKFFIRRTKQIIADQLPKKTDQVVFCPLTPAQLRVYKQVITMEELQNMLHRNDPCACGSGRRQMKCCVPANTKAAFKFMSILIKLSNHLGLILPSPTDTKEQLIRNRELAAVAFPNGNAPSFKIAMMDPRYCGKWKVLLDLLKEWKQDTKTTNKVLIFTKSVKLLDMLAHRLKIASYGFLQLDGNTKQSDRMDLIDQFHEDRDIFVFLISTMAGGTGLNLTGANKVVIFDPNWNPAHDLQAMDRAFRFGQTRDVSVVRLLGAGSIEELIYARQIYKQQQMVIGYNASIQTRYFEGVQGDKTKQGELFGLNNIFKLHETALATKHTIEKAQVAELDWALSSLEPKANGKRKKGDNDDVIEAEGKLDKEYGDMKGLGALLFDEELPPDSAFKEMYTHQNPDLLVPSKIEEERARKLVEKRTKNSRIKRKKPDSTRDSPPAAQWPPPRVHKWNKKRRKFESSEGRIKALIGMAVIHDPSELPAFARKFNQDYSAEQQAKLIEQLDEYESTSERSDQSDDGMRVDAPLQEEEEDIDM
ncbi:DNA excision repair protein ERCC-6-like 2 [Favolaschia claudopus]|uniref:DNA excision repair protein ERCC-6-like 2 n=1 Tax=Favolaschia claudopus TaxID=2862362 RepID=A0AAW0DU53_9AGAR